MKAHFLKYSSLLLLALLFSSPGLACEEDLTLAAGKDPFSLLIRHSDQDLFDDKSGWDERRYEQVAGTIDPNHEMVVYQKLLERYQALTGVEVKLHLDMELSAFLKQHNIPPSELEHIGGGIQGELYWHPKLGNQVIKICRLTFSPRTYSSQDVTQLEHHQVHDLKTAYRNLSAFLDTTTDAQFLKIGQKQLLTLGETFSSRASQALHRAYQLILPGLVFGQSQIKHVDIARVYWVGNGFFLREYYPNSDLTHQTGIQLLGSPSKAHEALDFTLEEIQPLFPVVHRMSMTLVGQIPSFFTSPKAYQEGLPQRSRIFIIFDLD